MGNYELQADEVILYEGMATSKTYKGHLQLILTSKKLVIEREKGLFKKERELIDVLFLENIKFYNEKAQISQKGSNVEIQTIDKNVNFEFDGIIGAGKFTTKLVDATTGTTIAKRGSDKIKGAFNMLDETLGLDTRGTIKGVLENGVKGAIFNGIGKKK